GLEHLVACGVSEGVVDRLQAIDVEHDQRTAGAIALDVGNRAIELALEAAPASGPVALSAGESSPWCRWTRLAAGIPGRMPAAVRFFARRPRFWGVFRPWRRSPWFSSSWPSLCRLAYQGLPGFTKTG